MNNAQGRILVIKHGAFGDVILATGPMRSIRDHHPHAHITLLTTRPFDQIAYQQNIFNDIITDSRPKGLAGLKQRIKMGFNLRSKNFDRVYDLQHSARTATYFQIMKAGRHLEWSGITKGCSHPHTNQDRDRMHTVERTAEQLRLAGLKHIPEFDLDWLKGDITNLNLSHPYAILVPAASPKHPAKMWPLVKYTELAILLEQKGLTPVIIGTETETNSAQIIKSKALSTLDLTGKTNFGQLASVGRQASLAIGNDTGPMHLISALGTKSLVLFSHVSEPAQTAPRGPMVKVLREHNLNDLSVTSVWKAAEPLINGEADSY